MNETYNHLNFFSSFTSISCRLVESLFNSSFTLWLQHLINFLLPLQAMNSKSSKKVINSEEKIWRKISNEFNECRRNLEDKSCRNVTWLNRYSSYTLRYSLRFTRHNLLTISLNLNNSLDITDQSPVTHFSDFHLLSV